VSLSTPRSSNSIHPFLLHCYGLTVSYNAADGMASLMNIAKIHEDITPNDDAKCVAKNIPRVWLLVSGESGSPYALIIARLVFSVLHLEKWACMNWCNLVLFTLHLYRKPTYPDDQAHKSLAVCEQGSNHTDSQRYGTVKDCLFLLRWGFREVMHYWSTIAKPRLAKALGQLVTEARRKNIV
jgi:hypothetical protein